MRYPRLEALRAQRQRLEREIAAPHKAATHIAMQDAREQRAAKEALERLMRAPLIEQVLSRIGHNVGEHVYREIMKAVATQRGFTGTTHLELPTDMLMAADPKSIVARVIDWWRSETAPKMSLRAYKGDVEMSSHVTILDIRLPAMGYREAVSDVR